jgi:hypothetical protein
MDMLNSHLGDLIACFQLFIFFKDIFCKNNEMPDITDDRNANMMPSIIKELIDLEV